MLALKIVITRKYQVLLARPLVGGYTVPAPNGVRNDKGHSEPEYTRSQASPWSGER